MFGVNHSDTDDSTHYSLENVVCDEFESYTFKIICYMCISLSSRLESVLRRMPQDLTDEISTLAQAMVWCRQAPRHYQSQR